MSNLHNKAVQVFNVKRIKEDCISLSFSIKTEIGKISISDIVIIKEFHGIFGWKIGKTENEKIDIPYSVEKEIISEMRKILKKGL